MGVLSTHEHSGISFPSDCPIPTCVGIVCGDLFGRYFSLELEFGVFR